MATSPPAAWPPDEPPFEQPVGKRRLVATAFALLGVGLVGLPLLFGQTPTNPAAVPLALLTLALLGDGDGVVDGLRGFHHNGISSLWPFLPLLAFGLLLLALDPRIRAMWRWIRKLMLHSL